MKRRIAFQYESDIALDLLTRPAEQTGSAICHYLDMRTPIKGLPKLAEFNYFYKNYLPYQHQVVDPCITDCSPKEFMTTAAAILTASRNRAIR